jgi:hypothetical protein
MCKTCCPSVSTSFGGSRIRAGSRCSSRAGARVLHPFLSEEIYILHPTFQSGFSITTSHLCNRDCYVNDHRTLCGEKLIGENDT